MSLTRREVFQAMADGKDVQLRSAQATTDFVDISDEVLNFYVLLREDIFPSYIWRIKPKSPKWDETKTSVFKDQAEFMKACGQTVGEFNQDQAAMYDTLITEEINELSDAETPEEVLKELMDCIVVLIGYGHSMGFDMDGAWKEVWESNMSKVDPETGTVLRREDNKVLKGPNYKPADVSKFV